MLHEFMPHQPVVQRLEKSIPMLCSSSGEYPPPPLGTCQPRAVQRSEEAVDVPGVEVIDELETHCLRVVEKQLLALLVVLETAAARSLMTYCWMA